MTFLPIVDRELRVASRRGATYGARVGSALAALCFASYAYLASRRAAQQQVGFILFTSLAWVSFLYSALAGARLTADCVSQEKREGTLGLLFLTDLKGYDVVLGKLAASSLNSVYGLCAVFPILTIPLLLGGVTAQQVRDTVLVLINTLFFSLATGLFFSVVFRQHRNAAGATFLFVLLLVAGPPALGAAFMGWYQLPRPVFELFYPSPAYGLVAALYAASPGFPAGGFWVSMVCAHVIGWGWLILASLCLPRVWQDKPATPFGVRWRGFWQRFSHGGTAVRTAFRRRLLGRNAFYWLAARDRLKPAYVWAALGLSGGLFLWGYLYREDFWRESAMYNVFSVVLHGAMKFWLGAAAVERLASDRRDGTLELILSTPLRCAEVFAGQWLALRRQFGGALMALVAADLFFCHLALKETYSERGLVVMLFAARMLILWADAYAIGWVGMWTAVTARHPNHAAAGALSRVLVMPWVIFISLAIAYETFELNRRLGLRIDETAAIWIWFGLGLVNDVAWVLWAKRRLHADFRAIATERYQARPTVWWRTLWGSR